MVKDPMGLPRDACVHIFPEVVTCFERKSFSLFIAMRLEDWGGRAVRRGVLW
jgi:hypothetical protein